MKTLYISDLDGTLLNNNSQISDLSANIINRLTDNGILFSVATARNIGTAFDKIKKLRLNAPISLMNGVFTYSQNNPVPIDIVPFPENEAILINEISVKLGLSPFIYTFSRSDNIILLNYYDFDYPPRRHFYELRKNATYKKFSRISSPDGVFGRKDEIPVYINFLDEYNNLIKIYDFVKDMSNLQSVFYFDPVLKAWYLEVFSAKAGKSAGVKKIAEIVNADRIVSFGDNDNDISMFKISDECYATANAHDRIQSLADSVIGNCNEDGVALFLQNRFKNLF